MDTLLQAISSATPLWQQSLTHAGWHHGVVTAAYLGAAWLCLMNDHLARAAHEPATGWRVSVAILCLLGANTLLQGDLWLVLALRAMAKLQGWYDARRTVQSSVLLMLPIMVLATARWWRAAAAATHRRVFPGDLGLGLLVLLFALRAVSLHDTDAVLNLRVLGLSLGRWFEFGAIGVLVRVAWRGLHLR